MSTSPHRPRFNELTKFERALFAITAAMTKRQLRTTRLECDKATTDNCSFVVFELRNLVRVMIDIELVRRDKRRRQQLLPGLSLQTLRGAAR
jgi:hypothetical protein